MMVGGKICHEIFGLSVFGKIIFSITFFFRKNTKEIGVNDFKYFFRIINYLHPRQR